MKVLKFAAAGAIALYAAAHIPNPAQPQIQQVERQVKQTLNSAFYDDTPLRAHADPDAPDSSQLASNDKDMPPAARILSETPPLADTRAKRL